MSRWPEQTVLQRVFNRVEVTDTCWFWIGRVNTDGYGTIKVEGKGKLVHRFLYEYLNPLYIQPTNSYSYEIVRANLRLPIFVEIRSS